MKKSYILLIISSFILVSACQQEDLSKRSSNTFIATYEHLGVTSESNLNPFTLSSALEMQSGELITVGTEVTEQIEYFIAVMKTDALGNELWVKRYPMKRRRDTNIFRIIELNDGSIFINSKVKDEILRITSDGDIIYHKTFLDDRGSVPMEFISNPLIEEDGTLYLAAAYHMHGLDPLDPTYIVVALDEAGETEVIQRYTNTDLVDISRINIVQVLQDTVSYIITGNAKRVNGNAIWGTFFFTVVQPTLADRAYYIDAELMSSEQDLDDNTSIYMNDNHSGADRIGDELLVLMQARTSNSYYSASSVGFQFSRASLSYSRPTELKTLGKPGLSYTANSFVKARDGNYYICGYLNAGLSSERSFLIKLNSNLNIVYEKYDFDPSLRFNQISECEDGSLLICGYTKNMGQGDDTKHKRWLMCRLNPDGSL